MLVKCGAVRPTGSPVASSASAGNGESPAAGAAVNGPALLPTDGKGGAEIQPDVGVDITGTGEPARLYRR